MPGALVAYKKALEAHEAVQVGRGMGGGGLRW